MRPELIEGVTAHARDAEVLAILQSTTSHAQPGGTEMAMAILSPAGQISRMIFPMGLGEYVRTEMALEGAGFDNTGHVFLHAGETFDDSFQ